ncbi:uncharacterized protein LOC105169955 isoform X1 [Sesamum indicum]|uniref:Uncharacterized protein LOC105169955 isoform X1 n=1 Tax=Sesamum indicum TaxID=4182 RepID=A0A6I9TV43_SESIN|nr:uncharacterized protein LOC105169955 isoform X1 [Sesamum indicum]XP_011088806.1 uncharacterized protein LOC105169955 isoform X1 [Sesamum indicum]
MAVAGLHNVSAFGPSFFGESQSPVSTQWGDEQGRPSTRASSLLQMWRELEGDHVVNHSRRLRRNRNGPDSECLSSSMSVGQGSDNGHDVSEDADETENQGATGSEMEHEDNNSIISEQSSDLGETERERVRQIFREWMNSGAMSHSSNGFHLNNRSGPQWLGENECGRVRVIREWVQTNAQQRNNQESHSGGVEEAGSQIEQVCDGLITTHAQIGARRPIRRLCGRQTLLDLLQRAQSERKTELHCLLEQRPVSDFAHRNRIQALLRGRFLRNERLTPDKRPSSVAATELGLLRQRHTVSGLREGFLSKLDNSASTSANSTELDSSFSDENNGESESTCMEREVAGIHTTPDSEGAVDRNRSQRELVTQATELGNPVLHNDRNEQEVSMDNEGNEQEVSMNIERHQQEMSLDVESADSRQELTLNREATEQEASADSEYAGSGHGEEINATTNELPLETEDANYSGPHEILDEHYEPRNGASYVHDLAGHSADLGRNTNEQFEGQDASARVNEFQESVPEFEVSTWQQVTNVAFTEWVDDSREETARSWQESSANQWLQGTSDNAVEQDQMQESHEDWPSHDLQEAIDSWLDMPSGEVGTSVRRMPTFYFPDDDNDHSMELRELFSRRRVSSLLRSGFRESLDQVLQSHVERQGHASGGWELDDASSSPSLVEEDQGQQNGRALALSADRNPFAPSSSLVTASQPLWGDEELQGPNLGHNNLSQQLGTEWEVINELRIDMARLQQRMNNMQSMLEACMDMQIELQRSVRQEVSAALNRSILTRDTDASKRNTLCDESPWDHVRRGICCLCCDNKIDSLLYRCGHMCTCSKCAEKLVQGTRKCPMCQAPVVEAVRAYFTH